MTKWVTKWREVHGEAFFCRRASQWSHEPPEIEDEHENEDENDSTKVLGGLLLVWHCLGQEVRVRLIWQPANLPEGTG